MCTSIFKETSPFPFERQPMIIFHCAITVQINTKHFLLSNPLCRYLATFLLLQEISRDISLIRFSFAPAISISRHEGPCIKMKIRYAPLLSDISAGGSPRYVVVANTLTSRARGKHRRKLQPRENRGFTASARFYSVLTASEVKGSPPLTI